MATPGSVPPPVRAGVGACGAVWGGATPGGGGGRRLCLPPARQWGALALFLRNEREIRDKAHPP